MTYRLLRIEEWDRLLPLMKGREHLIPSPEGAAAAVAEDDAGQLIGCLFFQLVFHMEPLVLMDPHVSFLRLAQLLEKELANRKGLSYYCFSGDDRVAKMVKLAGGEEMPYKIFRKVVE